MTTKIEMMPETSSAPSTPKKLLAVTPLAMLTSIVANLGLYAVAGRLYPKVTAWSGAGVGQIVGANFVYLLIGALVFALVARFTSRPARHYLVAASFGLLLSLALPISAGLGSGTAGTPPAGTATVITLSLMHIVSYAISVPLFIRLALD